MKKVSDGKEFYEICKWLEEIMTKKDYNKVYKYMYKIHSQNQDLREILENVKFLLKNSLNKTEHI